jgi:hypothetical protein
MKGEKTFLGILLCFVLFMGIPLVGQELQTGAIRGKVVDETGQPLPGVSIELTGSALLGKLAAVTNSEGLFKIPLVPPGRDYEIKAELQGFETIIRKGIIINLGKMITIDLQMKPATLKEEVEVTAPSPTVDVVKSNKSSVITSDVIFSLPNVRNVSGIMSLSPGTQGSSVYGGGAAEYTSLIDGVQAAETDEGSISLGFYGGIAWDTIEEVEVMTSGAPAQFFQAPEGVVNILMKSGSNKFHGGVNSYYTNKHLSDVRISDEEAAALRLTKPSFPIYQVDTGLSLSGPIIRDKIAFMSEFRYQGYKWAGNFIPTVIEGKQYNNYDRPYYNWIGFLKLSFLLAKNVRGSLMGHYSAVDQPYHRSRAYTTDSGNFYFKQPIRLNYAGNITWFVNNNTILDLRAGGLYFKWHGGTTPQGNPDGPAFYDDYTGYKWGKEGQEEYGYKPKFNISLTLTKYVDNFLGGDHEIKAGIEWERNGTVWGFYSNKPLWWTYYNGDKYYWRAQNNGQTDPVYGDGLLTYGVMGTTRGSSYEGGLTARIGGFVQDSFRLKRLTINAGIRLDTIRAWTPGRTKGATADPVALAIGETYFKPIYGINPYDEISFPTWNNAFPYGLLISPRFGFSYDLFGNHKTALKGSFTYESDPGLTPCGTFYFLYPEHYMTFTFNWWDLNNNGQPDSPPIDRYEEAYGDTPLYMVSGEYKKAVDPNAKNPFIAGFYIGLSHELLKDIEVGANFIYKLRKNVLGNVLWDEQTGRYWYSHELAPEWWIPFTTIVPAYGIFPAQQVTMYFLSNDAPPQFLRQTNIPEGRQKYYCWEFTFNKRMSKGWQLGGSIDFQKGIGNYLPDWHASAAMWNFPDANSFVNSYGKLDYSPIFIKLYGTFNLPYGFLLSFIYNYTAGGYWARGVTVVPPEGWAEEHNVALIPYYVQVEKPGTRRGNYSSSLDMRIGKEFVLGPGRIGLYADVSNLLGLYSLGINSSPGGTWRPADENTTEGTFIRGFMGLRSISGARTLRFLFSYSF